MDTTHQGSSLDAKESFNYAAAKTKNYYGVNIRKINLVDSFYEEIKNKEVNFTE